MSDILIINTGGTFNKYYNPIGGELLVDSSGNALDIIMKNWLCEFEVVDIIGKDSLEFNIDDRELILQTINEHKEIDKFIIIHGTDTMDITAKFLDENCNDKIVVLTGAMMPFSIGPIEATANFAMSYGFLANCNENGIYICMNGKADDYTKVKKDKIHGLFVKSDQQ